MGVAFDFWLDTQISEAKKREREMDDLGRHSEAQYWFGRWSALWDIKEKLNGKQV